MSLSVDIITRTKDRPFLLRRALRSVGQQTFRNWCHIVVNDGGAPAPLQALARELGPEQQARLKILHNQNSLGMEAASNLGIRAGTSPLVTFLDDDDTWDPDFLATCVELLEKSPQIMGVVTQTMRVEEKINGDHWVELNRFEMNPDLRSVTLAELLGTNLFCTNAFVFRRLAWERVGPYREDLPVLGDWEFNIRFLRSFDVAVVPRPLARYHTRNSGAASNRNSVKAQRDRFHHYRAVILNDYLRKDLDAGKVGLGVLMAVADAAPAASRRNLFARAVSCGVRMTRRIRKRPF